MGLFAKSLMATKANSKPCQTSVMELFLQVLTGYRGEFKILSKTYDGMLCENS